jgi:DNA-3-methyladenine glycosylase
MFGPPGVTYVYLIYGMYCCLNYVTEPPGQGAAVLLRGLEPVQAPAGMRSIDRPLGGPGIICRELGIDRSLSGLSLETSPIRVLEGEAPGRQVVVGARVGIKQAVDLPLRFRLSSR